MGWLDRFRKRPAPAEASSSTPTYPSSALPSEIERSFLDTPAMQRYRASRPVPSELPAAAPPPARGQRLLLGLMAVGVVLLVAAVVATLAASSRHAARLVAVGGAQVQAERLAKAAWATEADSAAAYAELKDSVAALSRHVGALRDEPQGGLADLGGLLPSGLGDEVAPVLPLLERTEKQAGVLLAQQAGAGRAQEAARSIGRTAAELVLLAEDLSVSRMQAGAAAAEVPALGTALALAQRVARSAVEVGGGAAAEPALQRGRQDVAALRAALKVLADQDAARPASQRTPSHTDKLAGFAAKAEEVERQFTALAGASAPLGAAREARRALLADHEPMRRTLAALQQRVDETGGFTHLHLGVLMAALALLAAGGVGLLRHFVQDQTARARQAEAQRAIALREQQEAKLHYEATQSAILRLMNELQVVAEGDLTQQCTVTEEITGAIADSVNYTVEELRNLVSQVQAAAGRVAGTTQSVEHTSNELLSASAEQLREIRGTGEAVLQMAGRLNEVSTQAQRMADVAQESLQAAAGGLNAVQGAIGGMHTIRDQIQDTSRRIKRLGESSQEIGEITELIADLTDQTNLLALNAAIQAASAGEAGRGFAIVAQEVQRLAERCAEAARQIAALVQTIQADTQDAVAAMEVSTTGVVEGSKLSDAAGAALDDIDRVTHQLSSLVERISAQAQQEATAVNAVAANIQHIFSVTEQTSEGTQSTVHRVRELARTAEELRALVARFKIA
ncbi:MAG: twitching motility protein PilJ [Pseudomonadota bacterium]|jgi:twitching motility protein PilJ